MRVVLPKALLGLLLCFVALIAGPSPTSAHTGFESSQPADGEAVDLPVSEIVLTFTGLAEPAGEGFVVLDPSGALREPDRVSSRSNRQVWILEFDPPLADGDVGVRWSVQAPDAHPITGAFSFTAGASAPTPTTSAPEASTPSSAIENDEVTGSTSAAIPANSDSPATSDSANSDAPGDDRSALASVTAATIESQAATAIDLDPFLDQGDTTTPGADLVGAGGRLIVFVGTTLAIGGLAFATTVVGDNRRDLRSVLHLVGFSALAIMAGTTVDFVANLAAANGGWDGVLAGTEFGSVATSAFGVAVWLRAAAGALLFVAVREARRSVAPTASVVEERVLATVAADTTTHHDAVGPDDPPVAEAPPVHRPGADGPVSRPRRPSSPWGRRPPVPPVLILGLLLSFTFDGHTATEGNRLIIGAVDLVHVVAASLWAGGVVALALVLWQRHRRRQVLGGLELALRFSVTGGVALALAGVAGIALSTMILDDVSQLWSTPWGRLLMAKTLAVAAAAAVGTYNHLVVIPWMNEYPDDDSRSLRIRNTATVEAILLVAVVALTAVLVGTSVQT